MIGLAPHETDPMLALERHKDFYDFVKGKKISPTAATFAHFVLARYYHPNTTYIGDAQQQAYEHLKAGKNLVFSVSHTYAHDPFVAAAMIQREKALRKARRNIVVLGKEPIAHTLEEKHPVVNKAARVILDNFIMLRVYRTGDNLTGTESRELQEYVASLVDSAGDMVVEESIARLDDNTNVAIFPEGTRRDEFSQVAPLFGGIADISLGSVPGQTGELSILPISIDHGENRENVRHADIVVGELVPVQGEKPELLAVVHSAMQDCVDNSPRFLAEAA